MLPDFVARVVSRVGAEFVRADPATLAAYASDALGQPHLPDLVVLPGGTGEVSALEVAFGSVDCPARSVVDLQRRGQTSGLLI